MVTTNIAVYVTNSDGTDRKSLSCQGREEKKLEASDYLSWEVTDHPS